MKTLYYNGQIYTNDQSKPYIEAMLIEEGRIIAIGNTNDLLNLCDDDTIKRSLDNRFVMPGFNDSHLHLYGFGKFMRDISLFGCHSLDEAKMRFDDYIIKHQPNKEKIIIGRGWHEDVMQLSQPLHKKDLDAISSVYPLIFVRVCGHACTLNSLALKLCGIDKSMTFTDGTIDFERGILTEQAMEVIEPFLEKEDLDSIIQTLKQGLAVAASYGITSLQTDDLAHIPGEDYRLMLQAYRKLHQNEQLNARINLQARFGNIDSLRLFLDAGHKTNEGDALLKIGPLKIMGDGSLGARTAALLSPYSDDANESGILYYDDASLLELMQYAHNHGMQIAIHAIGDKANLQAVDTFLKIQKNSPKGDMRHGIVHCQIVNDDILKKYQEANIIGYIQPIFLDDDIGLVEARLGKTRMQTSYAFASMEKLGIRIALGTDCPVTSMNPFENIHTAVLRQTLSGIPQDGFLKDEALTLEQAVVGYTIGGAFASFEEHIKGKLLPGFLADFIVLDQHIFQIPLQNIRHTKVLLTVMDGQVRYKAN